jgi:hypothetical protein
VRENRREQSGSPLRIYTMVILDEKTLTFQFGPGAVVMKEVTESIGRNAVRSVVHVHGR